MAPFFAPVIQWLRCRAVNPTTQGSIPAGSIGLVPGGAPDRWEGSIPSW